VSTIPADQWCLSKRSRVQKQRKFVKRGNKL